MLGRMTALDVISQHFGSFADTVQASSSYFSFSGYFIGYISVLLHAGVRGEPKAAFLKAPNFPRNLESDFGQYLYERNQQQKTKQRHNDETGQLF